MYVDGGRNRNSGRGIERYWEGGKGRKERAMGTYSCKGPLIVRHAEEPRRRLMHFVVGSPGGRLGRWLHCRLAGQTGIRG
jgi:hypothetical protein